MSIIQAIPASQIVRIVPSVLPAGGSALDLIGLELTNSTRPPIGQVLSFPNTAAVAAYFGESSFEATVVAPPYFLGYDNSFNKPAAMLFAQYPLAAVAGWMRGGALGLTLAQLTALSTGTIKVTIDGVDHTSSTINLSGATSFSNAAEIITEALGTTGPAGASLTGVIGTTAAVSFTGSIATTVLTVTVVASGVFQVGDIVQAPGGGGPNIITSFGTGTGTTGTYNLQTSDTVASEGMTADRPSTTLTATAVTGSILPGQELEGANVDVNTIIVAQLTGGVVGGAGTYTVSVKQHVVSEAMTTDMPTVTYDPVAGAFFFTSASTGPASSMSYASSVSGTLATLLHLTAATGAILSPGADAAVPAAFMDGIVRITRDWASFSTIFDTDTPGTPTMKEAFSVWVNAQAENYAYVAWDADPAPSTSALAASSFGQYLKTTDTNGVIPIWVASGTEGVKKASFAMGYAASLDFSRFNGRATLAFKHQTGLAPDVTDGTVAQNLEANGYNYYGEWSTANDEFAFMYPGLVSGPWSWADSYYDQIWLNNEFQLAFMLLLTTVGSIPYNQFGYGLIAAAAQDVIDRAGNFGIWRSGVTLSQAQRAEVNAQAGLQIDQTLSTRGWYFQVLDAPPEVRQARGSPPCTFWWMDGESVQRITLASVTVQ